MKVYRRSFWETEEVRTVKPVFGFALVFAFLYFYSIDYPWELYVCYTLVMVFLFFFPPISFFYVILYDDRVVVQNGICPFWKREYFYKNMEKIVLAWPGGVAKHFMQFFSNGKKSWHYLLDMVDPKDYQEIVDAIREKGVLVETKNLDEWVK